MGSPCEILLRGEDIAFNNIIADKLQAEIARLEHRYSRFLPDSITTQLNQLAGSGKSLRVDEETAALLEYANTCYQQSEGLFDITSGSLRHLWNYRELGDKQTLPDDKQISRALEKTGWHKVQWQQGEFALPAPGMEIDFGGIVKEYAADCVASLAESEGVISGMVELGGDIRIFGADTMAAEPKYPPWPVGIRDPHDADKACALVSLQRGALATSGDYERYTLIKGKKYSHILNPVTGWPMEGYSSVSVIADQCVLAGTASSIGVLYGENSGQWLQQLGLPYLCVDKQGKMSGTISNGGKD